MNTLSDSLSQLLEKNYKPGLETFKSYTERMHSQIKSNLEKFRKEINDGYHAILNEMKRKHIPVDLDLKNIEKNLNEGATFAEMLHFEPDLMLEMYKAALHLFEGKHFQKAANAFRFLTLLDPWVSTYWRGLGSSLFSLEKYADAHIPYEMAIAMDIESIDPYVDAVRCHLAERHKEAALRICHMAIDVANGMESRGDANKLSGAAEAMERHIKTLS